MYPDSWKTMDDYVKKRQNSTCSDRSQIDDKQYGTMETGQSRGSWVTGAPIYLGVSHRHDFESGRIVKLTWSPWPDNWVSERRHRKLKTPGVIFVTSPIERWLVKNIKYVAVYAQHAYSRGRRLYFPIYMNHHNGFVYGSIFSGCRYSGLNDDIVWHSVIQNDTR